MQRRDQVRTPCSAVILVWAAATLFGLGVAAITRIGPVLFAVSERHGVHLGELLAFAVAYVTALVITFGLTAGRG